MKRWGWFLGMLLIFTSHAAADDVANAALLDAAHRLDVQGVKSAIEAGADPNGQDVLGAPIYAAMGLGAPDEKLLELESTAVEILQVLFDHGAKLGAERDLLLLPVSSGEAKLVKLLLDHGANAKLTSGGYAMTELATKEGHDDVYNVLLAHGASALDDQSRAQLQGS